MNDGKVTLWVWKGFLPTSTTQLSPSSLLIHLTSDPSVMPRCHQLAQTAQTFMIPALGVFETAICSSVGFGWKFLCAVFAVVSVA